MKRFLVIMLCVVLVFALPIATFAEEDASSVEAETPNTETSEPEKSEAQVEAELTTDIIVGYIQEHLEEISVIITMILTVFYQVKKHASLNKSIGTLNNNAVEVAERSNTAIGEALTGVTLVSSAVDHYKDEIANLLAEVRANEEEKQKLASTIASVEKYMATTKAANIELANEIAELLVLANIPNSKKEELYSRHRAAVDAITAFENSEVNDNDTTSA